MKDLRRWRWLWLNAAALGLGVTALSGCQTHIIEASMTLPSGHYLSHYPQYIPPSPDYPLPRELANLQDASVGPPPAAPRPLLPGGGAPGGF
jgi:hypothetical protein